MRRRCRRRAPPGLHIAPPFAAACVDLPGQRGRAEGRGTTTAPIGGGRRALHLPTQHQRRAELPSMAEHDAPQPSPAPFLRRWRSTRRENPVPPARQGGRRPGPPAPTLAWHRIESKQCVSYQPQLLLIHLLDCHLLLPSRHAPPTPHAALPLLVSRPVPLQPGQAESTIISAPMQTLTPLSLGRGPFLASHTRATNVVKRPPRREHWPLGLRCGGVWKGHRRRGSHY
jgi:hypothetical protein